MTSKMMKNIEDKEREIVKRHMSSAPVKLSLLAQDLGVTVKSSHMKLGVSGQIKNEGGEYVIRINRYEPKGRQRFTVAHELAHFLLHRDKIDATEDGITDNVLYRSGQSNVTEFEANRLAAEIVMPAKLVKESLHEFGDSISDSVIELLADKFGVSKAAMEIRISGLI